jgi:hypothetical protein
MMADQKQGGDAQNGSQSKDGEDVEKTKTLAERAGGGSNKGSGLGANEALDQAGGQGGSGQDN